jgi:hypothetical protein
LKQEQIWFAEGTRGPQGESKYSESGNEKEARKEKREKKKKEK